VTVNQKSEDTNYIQFTVPIPVALSRGDRLVLDAYVRGPGRVGLAVQKGTSPWTTSMFETVAAPSASTWRHVLLPFTASDNHPAGDAVVFVRAAFGPQTVAVGGLTMRRLGAGWDLDRMYSALAPEIGIRSVDVMVDPRKSRQRTDGLGGNMANGRGPYGEVHDPISRWLIKDLRPTVVRIGLPLGVWSPAEGKTDPDNARLKQVLELSREAQAQGARLIASVWHGPGWLATEPAAEVHTWRRDRYAAGVEAWTSFLQHARDAYGVNYDYVSFNEADYGVNVKWSPEDLAEFMRLSTAAFRRAGLSAKWLVADTANGVSAPPFIRAAMAVPSLRGELGPVAFHSWDVRGVDENAWREIARLAREMKLPVWCTELGWDAGAWRYQPPVWPTKTNALNLALAYAQAIRLAESSNLMYWQYQNDYPLGQGPDGKFPAYDVVRQFARLMAPGGFVVDTTVTGEDLIAVSSVREGRARCIVVNLAGMVRVSLKGMGKGPWIVRELGVSDQPARQISSLTGWQVPTRSAWIIEPVAN